jgi:calcium permeable stress-gated cation channel
MVSIANNGNSTGIGQTQNGYSLSAFLTSLVTNAVIWTVEIALFIILRTLFKRIYEPRTVRLLFGLLTCSLSQLYLKSRYLVKFTDNRHRVDSLPSTPWSWIPKLLTTPTHLVISKSGLDGYFLLRYLRMMIFLFGGSMLFIWPVLLPINAVNQRGAADGITGMDLLSISNIKDSNRYWAHVVVAIAFVCTISLFAVNSGATCYLMFHELTAFIRIRQENLTSEQHKNTVRATTILVTSVPNNFLTVDTLRQLFSVFPGGVRNVFLNRDCSDLLDKVQLRDKVSHMLESAETDLIVQANKRARKEKVKKDKEAKKHPIEEHIELERNSSGIDASSHETGYLVDKYVPQKKRPTHHLPLASWMPSLPLIGKKVTSCSVC